MYPGANAVAGGSGRVARVAVDAAGAASPAGAVHAANATTTNAAAAQRAGTSAMLIVPTIPGPLRARLGIPSDALARNDAVGELREGAGGRRLVVASGELLTGELVDRRHDLIGGRTSRPAGGSSSVAAQVERCAEPHGDGADPGELRPDRLDLLRAGEADRKDGRARLG